MKTTRVWIEIIAVGTVIALGLALLIATFGTAAGTIAEESAAAQTADTVPIQQTSGAQQTYEGMVTCSRCGAKHSTAAGKTASDCTRICVHGGQSFALIDGDKSYALDGNLGVLKKVAGQRARLVGVLRGNTITVASLAPAS